MNTGPDRDATDRFTDSSAASQLGPSASSEPEADSFEPPPSVAPDDDELATVARAARAQGSPSPSTGKDPPSLLILGVVIFCIIGMAVYAIIFARGLMEKGSQARWRRLEQRQVDFFAQDLFEKQHAYSPAGKDVVDLTSAERAELRELRGRYGTLNLQPSPRSDNGRLVLIHEPDGTVISTQPAPATSP